MTHLVHIALVSLLIVAADACKLAWHGRWPWEPAPIFGHLGSAVLLGAYLIPWKIALVGVLAAQLAHVATYEAKQKRLWYGDLCSLLTTLPWQAAAAVAVTLPLWGSPWAWAAAAWWLALGAAIKWGLWQWRVLRPERWG